MENKIVIDKPTLKAIAVDSRLDLLKSLGKRQKTLSELSKEIGLSPATLKEHLDILLKVELIKKNEARKWKYYSLTYKGINLINPKETKALWSFVLGLIMTIGFGMFLLTSMLAPLYETRVGYVEDLATEDDFMVQTQVEDFTERTFQDSTETVNKSLIYNVVFFTLLLFTMYVGVFYFKKKKDRKR